MPTTRAFRSIPTMVTINEGIVALDTIANRLRQEVGKTLYNEGKTELIWVDTHFRPPPAESSVLILPGIFIAKKGSCVKSVGLVLVLLGLPKLVQSVPNPELDFARSGQFSLLRMNITTHREKSWSLPKWEGDAMIIQFPVGNIDPRQIVYSLVAALNLNATSVIKAVRKISPR